MVAPVAVVVLMMKIPTKVELEAATEETALKAEVAEMLVVLVKGLPRGSLVKQQANCTPEAAAVAEAEALLLVVPVAAVLAEKQA